MKFIFFIIINFINLSALASTTYIWKNEQEQINTGRCFEVDKLTLGEKYSINVKKEFCRPSKTIFIFQPSYGVCTEVDERTGGKEYLTTIKIDFCRPLKTEFIKKVIRNRFDCFEVDSKTKGKNFHQIASGKECDNKPKKGQFFWKVRATGSGDCYFSPENSQEKFKVDSKDCKPENTIYRFERVSPLKGICYEEHPENNNLYSKKVPLKNCKPLKTLFVFYKEPKKQIGHCYEIDSATKGDLFIKKSNPDLCK